MAKSSALTIGFSSLLAIFMTVILAGLVVIGGYEWYRRAERVSAMNQIEQDHFDKKDKEVAESVAKALARDTILQGVTVSSIVRVAVIEYYVNEGKLPSNNEQAFIESPSYYNNSGLMSVSVAKEGQIILVFNEKSGVKGGMLIFSPEVSVNTIREWHCISPDYAFIKEVIPSCEYHPEEKHNYIQFEEVHLDVPRRSPEKLQ